MNIKYLWVLMLFWFITIFTGMLLMALLSISFITFAGTAYSGGDVNTLIQTLSSNGITEGTFLIIIGMIRVWMFLAPCGFLAFGLIEIYSFLKKENVNESQELVT